MMNKEVYETIKEFADALKNAQTALENDEMPRSDLLLKVKELRRKLETMGAESLPQMPGPNDSPRVGLH